MLISKIDQLLPISGWGNKYNVTLALGTVVNGRITDFLISAMVHVQLNIELLVLFTVK